MATASYPKFLCTPCGASRRNQLAAGKKNEPIRATWMYIEREFPHKAKEAIRSGRVKPVGEEPNIPGVNCVGDGTVARMGIIALYEDRITARSGVHNQSTVMKLPKKAYMAQCLLQWGESPADAEVLWRAKIVAAGIQPDGPNAENIPVTFYAPEMIIGSWGRNIERSVGGHKHALTTRDEVLKVTDAMSAGHAIAELESEFKDVGGDVFKNVTNNGASSSQFNQEQLAITMIDPKTAPQNVQPDVPIGEADAADAANDALIIVPRSSVSLYKHMLVQ